MAGTVTLPGTETPPVAPRETAVAVEVVLFKETVQVELALLPSVDGVQLTPVKAGMVALSVKGCDPPFSVAVICVD